jgi:cytochrome c556
MKKVFMAAAVMAALVAGAAQAQVPPDRSVKYRQSALTVLSNHVGRLGAHAKGAVTMTPAQLEQSAQVVHDMAMVAYDGFLEGTEQSKGTKAKPEIWKEWAKFKEMQVKLQTETPKLLAAAKANDVKAIQAALGGVGGSCKTCHDAYQAKDVIQ